MRRQRLWMVLGVAGGFALACGGGEESEEPAVMEPPPVPEDIPVPEPAAEPAAAPAAGAMPFEFPTIALSGNPGQFVLTPSRQPLDEVLANGGRGTFIYYGAELVSTGPEESTVRSLSGSEYTMPNAMILPIASGQTAQQGDIVLGHWESGSGMQRAIVVGGTPTEPVVRYLDIAYDNPSGWGQKDDTFVANRFQVLAGAGQVGATVACQSGSDYEHGILTAVSGDRILVSGFAASLKAYDRSECVDVNPNPTLAVGDTVQVPVVGKYKEGTVTALDLGIGRVTVSYTWGGTEEEKVFSIVDVTHGFDGDAASKAPDEESKDPGDNADVEVPEEAPPAEEAPPVEEAPTENDNAAPAPNNSQFGRGKFKGKVKAKISP